MDRYVWYAIPMMTLTFTQVLALALAVFVLGSGLVFAAIAYAFGKESGAGCVATLVLGGTLFFSGACFYLALAVGF